MANEPTQKRAVFLDRDGTLMRETDYCSDPHQVSVFPGANDALQKLKQAGFLSILITNQSGIGRGYFSQEQYESVQQEFLRQLGSDLIDATYMCPDAPDQPSTRRKPLPGMVLEAARDFQIDLARSFFVGDKTADIECGKSAGTKTILVQTGYGLQQTDATPDFIAKDIVEAAKLISENAHV